MLERSRSVLRTFWKWVPTFPIEVSRPSLFGSGARHAESANRHADARKHDILGKPFLLLQPLVFLAYRLCVCVFVYETVGAYLPNRSPELCRAPACHRVMPTSPKQCLPMFRRV